MKHLYKVEASNDLYFMSYDLHKAFLFVVGNR